MKTIQSDVSNPDDGDRDFPITWRGQERALTPTSEPADHRHEHPRPRGPQCGRPPCRARSRRGPRRGLGRRTQRGLLDETSIQGAGFCRRRLLCERPRRSSPAPADAAHPDHEGDLGAQRHRVSSSTVVRSRGTGVHHHDGRHHDTRRDDVGRRWPGPRDGLGEPLGPGSRHRSRARRLALTDVTTPTPRSAPRVHSQTAMTAYRHPRIPVGPSDRLRCAAGAGDALGQGVCQTPCVRALDPGVEDITIRPARPCRARPGRGSRAARRHPRARSRSAW